jgi:hypothetical protein
MKTNVIPAKAGIHRFWRWPLWIPACAGMTALMLSACAGSNRHLKTGKTVEGEVVEAEGIAPYKADDLPGSKAAALAAAQRSAVELVVGVYVNAKTRVDKAVAIEQNILTRASGYVKRYEILSEGPSGPWYKMRIRALVATGDLHNDLDSQGLLRQAAVGNPRVAVLLKEYIRETESKEGFATQALTQALLDQGFKVVQLPRTFNLDEDPLELAKSLNHQVAELLITGFARAQSMEEEKKLGGMSSYRATISFRVVETGTGEVMQTVSEVASGLEATPEIAAQKAFQATAQLTAKDLANLPQELSKRAHIDLTISGLKSFTVLSDFQKGLLGVPGVKDLYLRSYNQEQGVAVLDVMADQISPQELADQGVRIGGADWSIFQVAGRSVQLSASQAGH